MDMKNNRANVNMSTKEVVIGNTTYIVTSYCSLSRDEIKSKIARLIKNEAKKSKV